MDIFLVILLWIFLVCGVVLTACGLFGNTVVFSALVIYAIITGFGPLSLGELLVLGVLFAAGEFIEYLFTLLGVKWLGASKLSGWMAILGTVIGAFIGGLVLWGFGVIIGGFIGAMVGAMLTELAIKKHFVPALKAALGAFAGKVGAMFIKLAIALIMLIYVAKVIRW